MFIIKQSLHMISACVPRVRWLSRIAFSSSSPSIRSQGSETPPLVSSYSSSSQSLDYKNSLVGIILKSDESVQQKQKLIEKVFEKLDVEILRQRIANEKLRYEILNREFQRANAELLREKGLFSVRGMMVWVEEQAKEKYDSYKTYSRKAIYTHLATIYPNLTKMKPVEYGETMSRLYQNLSKEIRDGKRSPEEVTTAGDAIIVRGSSAVDYKQCQGACDLATFFHYPFKLKPESRISLDD